MSLGEASIDGATVRRPMRPWLPAVGSVLEHFEAAGFQGAPRLLASDEQDRQVVSYIEGEAYSTEWPEALRRDTGLAAVARLVRAAHEASADFRCGPTTQWIAGLRPQQPGDVLLHGDLSLPNLVWRRSEPTALIDWEFAEPGPAWNDVLHGLFSFAPLINDAGCRAAGFPEAPDRLRRVEIFLAHYGLPERYAYPGSVAPRDAVRAVIDLMVRDRMRFEQLGGRDRLEPWATYFDRGAADANQRLAHWIEQWLPTTETGLDN